MAGFLAQFAPRGLEGVFAVVDVSRGQVIEPAPHTVLVLLHKQHLFIRSDGENHGHIGNLRDEVVGDDGAVGQFDFLFPHREPGFVALGAAFAAHLPVPLFHAFPPFRWRQSYRTRTLIATTVARRFRRMA